jgi:hypothetical protein
MQLEVQFISHFLPVSSGFHFHTHVFRSLLHVWQHCVAIPLAKHLVATTGKVEKVKECVVRRQGTERGLTKVR